MKIAESRLEIPAAQDRDPLVLSWLVTAAFFALAMVQIEIPSFWRFDEVHYVPAAARLWLGIDVINREHPMLGKELIAVGLGLFGNQPLGWRIASLIAGSLGLFCATRALWWHSGSARASILFGVLLATQGLVLSLARLATLDIFVFAFTAWAMLLFTRQKWSASGAAFGLALACKWSVVPVLALSAIIRLHRAFSWRTVLQFGILPLGVYFLTYLPGMFVGSDPLRPGQLILMQWEMAENLASPGHFNASASHWWQWVLNYRPLWLLHREADGAYRLLLIAGNPISTLAIPIAVALELVRSRQGPALFYVALLAFWALSGQAIQFYHHYLLAAAFGLAALSLQLSRRRFMPIFVAATLLAAAWLYPAWTAAPVQAGAETRYTWVPGWHLPG